MVQGYWAFSKDQVTLKHHQKKHLTWGILCKPDELWRYRENIQNITYWSLQRANIIQLSITYHWLVALENVFLGGTHNSGSSSPLQIEIDNCIDKWQCFCAKTTNLRRSLHCHDVCLYKSTRLFVLGLSDFVVHANFCGQDLSVCDSSTLEILLEIQQWYTAYFFITEVNKYERSLLRLAGDWLKVNIKLTIGENRILIDFLHLVTKNYIFLPIHHLEKRILDDWKHYWRNAMQGSESGCYINRWQN